MRVSFLGVAHVDAA